MKRTPTAVYSILIFCIIMALTLCGCSEHDSSEPPRPVMQEVYDDGLYTVDTGYPLVCTDADGQSCMLVHLHIANRTDAPLTLSSLLCVTAECNGVELPCMRLCDTSCTDTLATIDGIVPPDGYVDGWVAFAFAEHEGPVTISIAVDYCADERISFTLPE